MNGFTIQEQKVGRGKDNSVALIKSGAQVMIENNGVKSLFRPKTHKGNLLPFLKVVLSDGDAIFECRWSNYYESHSDSPGKFKIVRIDQKPLIIYVKNDTGRVAYHNGKPIVDYTAMATQFGSHYVETEPKKFKWEFGPRQEYDRTEELFDESQSMESFHATLVELFDESIADQVLTLFIEHEDFRKFLPLIAA